MDLVSSGGEAADGSHLRPSATISRCATKQTWRTREVKNNKTL